MTRHFRQALLALLALTLPTFAADPIVSGLKPGQRPGPYTSLVSVGPQRGQLHCFICETEDKPAVVVFARSLTEGLGKLVRGLDKAVIDNKKADLRAWVTFLHDDQQKFDPLVVAWGRQQGVKGVSLSVFEDLVGPPTYRLHPGADITVMVFVKEKVVRNFAFKAGTITDGQIGEIVKAVGAMVK